MNRKMTQRRHVWGKTFIFFARYCCLMISNVMFPHFFGEERQQWQNIFGMVYFSSCLDNAGTLFVLL